VGATAGYGSHPERLSDLLGCVKAEERRQVRLLGHEESGTFESTSLNKLPQTNWGTIDWDKVSRTEQYPVEGETDGAELVKRIVSSRIAPDSDVVVFWANLVVPTLYLPVRIAVEVMEEVLAVSHDVWLYFSSENFLIEYFHEGQVTAVSLPE
jgi:hypothetical protein